MILSLDEEENFINERLSCAGEQDSSVPTKIISVTDIPRTISGKIAELAVLKIVHNETVKNTAALINPEALENFKNISELQT